MVKPIKISKSPSADSRSAPAPVTIDILEKSTKMHISDVKQGCDFIAERIREAGEKHDNTKTKYMKEFYDAMKSGAIKESAWYKKHITEETHHLMANVPDDVTLIDVAEYAVDIVMAGMARSGEIYDSDLAGAILEKALANTIKLLKDNIEVDDADLLDTPISDDK